MTAIDRTTWACLGVLAAIALLLAGCATCDSPSSAPPEATREGEDAGVVNRPEHADKPYVVLISFDGFRADYLDRTETPAFDRLVREGARAEALIPVFPSKTFPNHYSIVTGMYPEAHGIIGNTFYDPERDATYSMVDSESVMDGTWYRGEPIWVTAETQGMVTATYFWVGSEADVQGVRPSTWMRYSGDVSIDDRIDTVLGWLERPAERRPHLITTYFSDVDKAGHRYGPDAPEVDEAIRIVDAALGELLVGIERLPIADEVYVVLVSDHGMASNGPETAVAIDELIDMEGVHMPESGPLANLHVEGGQERARAVRDELNASLEQGRAYLRDEVPEELRYRADPRIGDVVVVMEEHWQVGMRDRLPRSAGGNHGWEPRFPSMHGIFIASGPRIEPGATIPAFENVHVYPFLAELLGLEPHPETQGDPDLLRNQVLTVPTVSE